MNSKFEFLFPKRVYRCPCLHAATEECFHNDKCSIADIVCYLKDIDSKNLLSTRMFLTRVGKNKEHCLFTCETNLKTVWLAVEKICVHHLKMTILFVSSILMWRRFVAKTVWKNIWYCCILIFIFLTFDFSFSFLFQKKKQKWRMHTIASKNTKEKNF